MTTMIERVARAIFEECNRQDPVAGFGYADADGGKTVLDGAYDLAAVARAVIEVMREPTEGMLVAGARSRTATSRFETGDDTLEPEWLAMIDAALKETQP